MSKKLEFKNGELLAIGKFLADLKLKNMASLGRTRLLKLLDKKNKEFIEDRDEIRDPYFVKDESGKPVVKDDKYQFLDKSKAPELKKELDGLADEEAVIEFTEYSEKLKALYVALSNYDFELSNSEAFIYSSVMEQLEKNFVKEDEK